MTIRNFAIAPALAAALLLAACSSEESGVTHSDAAVSSSAGLPAGNIAAGERLALEKRQATGQSCVDCHGAEGLAPIDASYPLIGGQYADYTGQALQAYRNGNRDHALMASQAKDLTDQQIADLAAYFGSREGALRTIRGVGD